MGRSQPILSTERRLLIAGVEENCVPDPGVDDRDSPEHHPGDPGGQARGDKDKEARTSCGDRAGQPLHTENSCKEEETHSITGHSQ